MPIRDAAWHDRMYNNRLLVPDFLSHFNRWRDGSALALAQLPVQRDLRYGDGPQETLDVFPALRPKAPVVVFIHGGYWKALDKSDHAFVAPPLRGMGACTVVVNYALCPGSDSVPVTIPDIALQMSRALAWVWRHIGLHGGDRDNITVAGHSAGGHLAAMLLACRWPELGKDLPEHLVRKALSVSGLFDLEPIRKTPHLQADLRISPTQVRLASPAKWPAPQQGVLYSVVGGDESEEFLRHNRMIRQAWGASTVPVSEVLPGLNHFSVIAELTRPDSRLHALMRELMARPA